jgi:hypothetical protein
MYRLSISIAFFIFLLHFATHAQNLNLNKVSVEDAKITLNWQYNSIADSVTIYKCSSGCTQQNNYDTVAKVKMELNNLKWVDNDTVTKRNYYCVGWRYSGKSIPQNNMVLEVTIPESGCENSALLTWNPYINMRDSLEWYKILYRKISDPDFAFYDSIPGEHLVVEIPQINPSLRVRYEAKNLDATETYFFKIQAVGKNAMDTIFSNIAKYETGEVDLTPVIVSITSVSAVNDKYLQIEVTTDFSKPFHELEFWRSDATNNFVFEKIYTTNYKDTNLYRYDDENANPKAGLYHYRAIVNNHCKASDYSNTLSNIFLEGFRVENYTDSVFFTHERTPSLFLQPSYELLRIVNQEEIFIAHLSINNPRYYVDVEPFLVEGAEVKYQIKTAIDCYSNTLTLEHEPRLFFPTAFDPKSINLENQTFYPILQFSSSNSYLFTIYNRWGEELYRSTLPPVFGEYGNMQGRWDGTYKGKECPAGIYAYKLTYRYYEGTKNFTKSGTFMLVR